MLAYQLERFFFYMQLAATLIGSDAPTNFYTRKSFKNQFQNIAIHTIEGTNATWKASFEST